MHTSGFVFVSVCAGAGRLVMLDTLLDHNCKCCLDYHRRMSHTRKLSVRQFVLLVGMDDGGGGIGVPGVALRPLFLSEMARVIALCGVCRSLQRFVAWLPPSVLVPGVVNVLEDTAV